MNKPANPNPGYEPSDPKNIVRLANGVEVWMTNAEQIAYCQGSPRGGSDRYWTAQTDRLVKENR